MAIVGYRFSRVTIAAVFVLLSVIALITGCRIFSGHDDEGYYPQVTATSMSGRILVPADLAGYVGVASAEVWIEDLADNLKYHSRTNASGVYVINDVPPGPHRVITRLENGGLAVMKNRSAEINVSETPGVVPVPDMPLLVAKNIVTGQLRDADGNFLPENTVLTLWGETFPVGKDGFFTSPPMPDSYSEAEILVQLPLGGGVFSFNAPFVSDVVPAFMDLTVGANPETGNNAPSVTLMAYSADGKLVSRTSSGDILTLVAIGADVDPGDQAALVATWSVSAGTLNKGSSDFEKRWTAPDQPGVATISVEVKDLSGATGRASLPILVDINDPSQADTSRPTVVLSSETEETTDSEPFVVRIAFNEPITGFAIEDVTVTNGSLSDLTTVTASRVFTVKVTPSAEGEVKVTVLENIVVDAAGNKNTAGNTITVTNSITPPAKSSEKALQAFAFSAPEITGSIDETNKTVSIIVPFDTDFSALVASFTVSEKAVVKVGDVAQISGETENDFSDPVTYTVVAEDGTKQDYIVTAVEGEPIEIKAATVVIAAPVIGAEPQDAAAVEAATNNDDYIVTGLTWNEALTADDKFKAGQTYTATVILTSKNSKKFQTAAFTPTVEGSESVGDTTTTGSEAGNSIEFTITFAAIADAVVDALNLSSLVTAPVKGATPVTAAIDQTQYTSGAISWFEADGTTAVTGNFAAAKVYVAKLTLSAKAGYTLTGVAGNSFSFTGATSVANAANSGAITITFAAIADAVVDALNLSSLVTAPIKGAAPVTTAINQAQYTSGAISWFEADGTTAVTGNFAVAKVYVAKLTLTAKAGYTLTGVAGNSFSYTGATSVANAANSGAITITFAATADAVVDALNLSSLVTAPVKGATPVTAAIDQTQYTSGAISWFEADGTTAVTGNFAAAKVYVAKLTLTAKAGYTLTGVTVNSFSYTGATSVANAANSGAITITFAATADAVVNALNLSSLVTAPVKGATPVTAAIDQTQYTSGAISWFEADGTTAVTGNFAAAKVYVAKLTLTAKAGYTLTGVTVNSFSFTDATSVANAANSGAITITFAATAVEPITAIGAITGISISGQTLTAGALTPVGATADYKWQVSDDGSTGWADIGGAIANTYVVGLAVGKYVRVVATGNGTYGSTVNSAAVKVVTAVTAIGAVSGVPMSGQTLTAGALTPVGATADYKWQVSDDGSTGWADIGGAIANTYVVGLAVGKYVRVVATGNGDFGGVVNSAAVKVVTAVTAIGAVSGVPMSGQTLTAGALTPVGATVDYKWQVSDDGSTGWADIGGATANTYVVGLAVGKYVRAVATGNGNFGGVVNSVAEKIQGMPTMVSVPAGTFQRDANTANTSFVSAFSMSAHEITRVQFTRFMGTDPSDPAYSNGNADPVQKANWYHAIAFCNKLSLAEGLTPVYAVSGSTDPASWGAVPLSDDATWDAATCNWSANGYRLPTEMEWMWAAMGAPADGQGGGTNATGYSKAFAGNDGTKTLDACVWYFDNSSNKTHPAGSKLANELGLYDMSGNVFEWCWDWYGSYPANSNSDYRGAGTGSNRLLRGGSFNVSAGYVTVANRLSRSPYNRGNGFGFRVVRSVITPLTAIGSVSGTPKSGQTLTAGALTPSGATANYQWQVSVDGISGGWADILGETANTYVVDLAKSAVGKHVRVTATGKDSYSGTVYSSALNIWGDDYTSANIGTLKYVPAGTFQRDANAANTSFVSAFRMSAHEITRVQFTRFMGTDPSDTAYSNGNDDPVQKANWYHAIAFCNKLSLAEGLTPAYTISGSTDPASWGAVPLSDSAAWNAATCDWNANGYRLPTEMEWMWAAMGAPADGQNGGTNTSGYSKAFAGNDGTKTLDACVWYFDNSSNKTHPAGSKLANELGLYDMSGNVWEWCWDCYDSYPDNSNSDYRGAGTGSYRLIRGGCWYDSAVHATVAFRNSIRPYNRYNDVGFRVVRP